MKCEVYNCKFNDSKTCTNLDEVIIAEGLEGLYCVAYKEKDSVIKSKFHINKESISDYTNNDILVISKSYEDVLAYMDTILKECENKFGYYPTYIYIDSTLSNGVKNSGRFAKIKLAKENKDWKYDRITNGKEYENLKRISALFFNTNPKLLDNSVLTSVQKKMLTKGIII